MQNSINFILHGTYSEKELEKHLNDIYLSGINHGITIGIATSERCFREIKSSKESRIKKQIDKIMFEIENFSFDKYMLINKS
jgi:hypothetical protein